MVPRILIFSIAKGADYSFEVKNIEIGVPAFFKHENSFVASVYIAAWGFLLYLALESFASRCNAHKSVSSINLTTIPIVVGF